MKEIYLTQAVTNPRNKDTVFAGRHIVDDATAAALRGKPGVQITGDIASTQQPASDAPPFVASIVSKLRASQLEPAAPDAQAAPAPEVK